MRSQQSVSAEKETTTELLRISEEILEAICSHDAETLSSYLTSDFVFLSGASRQARESFLDGVGSADFKALQATFEAIEVEVWGTTAVVAGIQCVEVEHGSENLLSRAAFTDVFIRENGRWLLRLAVSTELEGR